MFIDKLVGPNAPFKHVSPQVMAYLHEFGDTPLPPAQIRQSPDYGSRSHLVSRFQMKDYGSPVLADEAILIGVAKSCTEIMEICFRGSEAGGAANMVNIVTGAPAVDADGNEIAINDCFLAFDEVATDFPASDVYLVRLDCPQVDAGTQELIGIELLAGASGVVSEKPFGLSALKETEGGAMYGVVVCPNAEVPDLASVSVVLEIIGRSGV